MPRTHRRLVAALAGLLAVALTASSCSDDTAEGAVTSSTTTSSTTTSIGVPTTSGAPPTPTTAAPARPVASIGCGAEAPAPGIETLALATADGLTRSYRRFIPSSYDPDEPIPVVLNFHGLSGSPEAQVLLSQLEPVAEAEGFVLVHPQGTVAASLGATFWNNEPGASSLDDPTLKVDDVAFVEQMLDQLQSDLCVDLRLIYSTGMSNGGMFTSRLACDLSERLAAVATVAGVLHPDDCDPTRPIPLLHIHGTADTIVPFDVGPSILGDEIMDALTGSIRSIPDQVDDWSDAYDCSATPTVVAVSDTVERREYRECDDGGAVDFYVVTDGGHTWPGVDLAPGLEAVLGVTTLDIDGAAVVWDWFERHPLT